MATIFRLTGVLFFVSVSVFASDYEGILDRMDELKQRSEMRAVENRIYPKQMRLGFSPTVAMVTSDPYMDVYLYGVSLGFSFWEQLGIEGTYLAASVAETNVSKSLNEQFPTRPVASKMKSITAVNLIFSPIYAKMSVLSNFILHYDLYFTFGAGQTATNWETAFTYIYGLGLKFFTHRSFALDLSIRDYTHKEQRQSEEINKHNVVLQLGLNAFVF